MSTGAGKRRSKSRQSVGHRFPFGGQLLNLDQSKRLSAMSSSERAAAVMQIARGTQKFQGDRNVR